MEIGFDGAHPSQASQPVFPADCIEAFDITRPKVWNSLRRPFFRPKRLSRGSRSSSLLCCICFRAAFNLEVILTNREISRSQQCPNSHPQNHMGILWQLIQGIDLRPSAERRCGLTMLEGEKSDENTSEKPSARVLIQVAKSFRMSKLVGRIYPRPPTASPCYFAILRLADSLLRETNRLLAV